MWDVEVLRDATGWTAEFRIPFSQLRFNNTDGGPVGFAVVREVGRLAETSSWPLLSRNATGFVSQFAEVRGLRMAGSPKKLELLPYTLASLSTRPPGENPLVERTDPAGSVGLDLKYAVRPGLTLTAAVNPDFGQVEADPAVVNLDAFEIVLSGTPSVLRRRLRKLPVQHGLQRRRSARASSTRAASGATPQGSAGTVDGEYSSAPSSATILGAGKLTGRLGKFSVGALSALTADEYAVIASGLARREEAIEPKTGYSVLRARREFANQSNLGFMLTSTNRRLVDTVSFLADDAVHRRRGLRLAHRTPLQRHGALGRQPRHRRSRGDHPAAGKQRAPVPAYRMPTTSTSIRWPPSYRDTRVR